MTVDFSEARRNRARRAHDRAAGQIGDLVNAELTDHANRADSKAGQLLGLFGVLAAAVVAVASKAGLGVAATIVLWISATPMIAALVVLLLAVRPVITGAPFEQYARWTTALISKEFHEAAADPIGYRADRARDHASAVVRKLRACRRAVHLVLLGGIGLVLAAILAAI